MDLRGELRGEEGTVGSLRLLLTVWLGLHSCCTRGSEAQRQQGPACRAVRTLGDPGPVSVYLCTSEEWVKSKEAEVWVM